MANNKTIELTQQELEDLKDDIKFKTTVLIDLKRLRGIPDKVNSLCIHRGIHWFLLTIVLVAMVSLALKK